MYIIYYSRERSEDELEISTAYFSTFRDYNFLVHRYVFFRDGELPMYGGLGATAAVILPKYKRTPTLI